MPSSRRFPPPWTIDELNFAVPSVTAFLMTIVTLTFVGANALEAIHALHRLRLSDFGLLSGRYDDDWHTASDSDRIT
jgi:hypothetical protein